MIGNSRFGIIILLCLVALMPVGGVYAQTVSTGQVVQIALTADRNVYVSGEELRFCAFLVSDSLSSALQDKIIFVDLLDVAGQSIFSSKYRAEGSMVSGKMLLSKEINAGPYVLRAYYQELRKQNSKQFAILPLTILRPDQTAPEGRFCTSEVSPNSHPQSGIIGPELDIKAGTLRSGVLNSVVIPQVVGNDFASMGVSIVPINTASEIAISSFEKSETGSRSTNVSENSALVLTGRVINGKNNKPGSFVHVALTILGDGMDFMEVVSDSSGLFTFNLPLLTGRRDIFLTTLNEDKEEWTLAVDNEYYTAGFEFLLCDSIDEYTQVKNTWVRLIQNFQIQEFFCTPALDTSIKRLVEKDPFYGKPDETIRIDDYVSLPSLGDYFNELNTHVKVRKTGDVRFIKVLGTDPGLHFYKPLVLVDGIPVQDIEHILAIKPDRVEKVEVVNKKYIKGEMIYGGVVNVVSVNDDFAGVTLPEHGVFINYSFLGENDNVKNNAVINQPCIDARNTIYWEPELVPAEDGNYHISFMAGAKGSRYTITLFGVAKDGLGIYHQQVADVW